jgi:hypothetical protein
MTRHDLTVLVCAVLFAARPAEAQTRLRLSTVIPGSERVQLVYNGDFQFQGPLITNSHPLPTGWVRQADMFADAGTNTVPVNSGVVALAHVATGGPICLYYRTVKLEPNTAYVLSAYLWNMGDAANHVTTVIDLNDAPNEPQITLAYTMANADQGYFCYRSFNTANTGSSVTLRIFGDGLAGTGAAAAYAPVGAQWDNLAITKATDFAAPAASGSGANLRPLVRIDGPADGAVMVPTNTPATYPIMATASDLDGAIAKVEFYAGANKLGEVTNSPYTLIWSNLVAGAYQLTARATDTSNSTTISAPVAVSLFVPFSPERVALNIARSGTNSVLSWPASATAASLQIATNFVTTNSWRNTTNAPALSNNQNLVTTPATGGQKFFRLGDAVDPTTLNKKLMFGYQGWFLCPQDGSPVNRWIHWFRSQTPVATNATVDFWPDISELDADELFATAMTLSNGTPAKVYSAYNRKSVVRHFKWMKDHHLDGVFLQRFVSELNDPDFLAVRNQVTLNVRMGAETYGRVFAIEYDISGAPAGTVVSTMTNDWLYLVNTLKLTNSARYLRHKGKPVVGVWGFGFTDRPGTPQDAQTAINFFKSAGCTVMGGVPSYWRTLTADSQSNPAWAAVYRSYDIINPWMVGRFADQAGADNFKQNVIVPDLTEATANGRDYMPVIFPGFSWHNLLAGPVNQIPRNGGSFYWRQIYNARSAGCTMVFNAMFDEVDEGTAMFKMAPTPNELPTQGTFVPLNIDGQSLPSDWYLRVADEAGKMLRGEIPLQSQLPIAP